MRGLPSGTTTTPNSHPILLRRYIIKHYNKFRRQQRQQCAKALYPSSIRALFKTIPAFGNIQLCWNIHFTEGPLFTLNRR